MVYLVNHRSMLFLCVKLPFHYLCPEGLFPSHLCWFHSKGLSSVWLGVIELVWPSKMFSFTSKTLGMLYIKLVIVFKYHSIS